jgi:hypothetical protein
LYEHFLQEITIRLFSENSWIFVAQERNVAISLFHCPQFRSTLKHGEAFASNVVENADAYKSNAPHWLSSVLTCTLIRSAITSWIAFRFANTSGRYPA